MGFTKKGFQSGYLYFWFLNYTNANDNQVVPITTMESLELKMLNYQNVDEKTI